MKTNVIISIIIVFIVILGLAGIGFGIYWFFFNEQYLFELEVSEIKSIHLIKDNERIVFDSQEDVEWFVSRLNDIKYKRKDTIANILGPIPNYENIRIDIEGEGGGTYKIDKNFIWRGRDMYRLTDESKKIAKEIMEKLPE